VSLAWHSLPASVPVWAKADSVPSWLALRQGTLPVVIVAPHGGRRRRAVRRGDSVNDLYTAEIAWELARRLDAHAIVNHGLDRNDIDLNRISHLADRAPDVLALLRSAVEHAAGDRPPLVLFVHGWNMVVPCCDVGVGLRLQLSDPRGRFPTLSRRAFEQFVVAMKRALSSRGISTGIGRRYSASGRDNAAQLFSGRHREHESADVAALAELALAGGVEAAQLELGIPLRWPGALRDALVDGCVEAVAQWHEAARRPSDCSSAAARAWCSERSDADGTSEAEPGYALQAVLDGDGGVGLFCGVEPTSASTMAGRFCLVCTDGSMMLLVGEGDWSGRHGHYELEGFQWRSSTDGAAIRLQVHGPVIRYRSHDAYLDLESGLADSELAHADVDLTFESVDAEAGHGRLRGRVSAAGMMLEVDTTAFVDRGGRRGSAAHPRMRVLAATESGTVRIESTAEEATLRFEKGDSSAPLGRIVIGPACPVTQSTVFLAAVVTARVPVWRPAGGGAAARWTFGMASLQTSHTQVPALFDSLEVFSLPGR